MTILSLKASWLECISQQTYDYRILKIIIVDAQKNDYRIGHDDGLVGNGKAQSGQKSYRSKIGREKMFKTRFKQRCSRPAKRYGSKWGLIFLA